jgi:hypothetical protein
MLDPDMGARLLEMPLPEQSAYLARLDEVVGMSDRMSMMQNQEAMQRWEPDMDTVQRVRALGGDIFQTSKGGAQVHLPKPPDPPKYDLLQSDAGLFYADPTNPQAGVIPIQNPTNPGQVLPPKRSDPLGGLLGAGMGAAPAGQGAAPAAPAAAAPAQVPMVRSQAEYDALPPGAQYRDANGNIRTKR